MLERVWRKGKPLTLLVGMQTGTATMENSVEISKVLAFKVAAQAAPLLCLGQSSGIAGAHLLGLDQCEVSSPSLLLNNKG